ncbi:unnamed protein product [Anisakis simplex]|uniref:Uncharacterized protein n=1 Tax=Anisakis simplex TaxID=6269 RepID=A0A0M3JJ11_ANISI|nr:unnamed protein product [Anisakis simplex]
MRDCHDEILVDSLGSSRLTFGVISAQFVVREPRSTRHETSLPRRSRRYTVDSSQAASNHVPTSSDANLHTALKSVPEGATASAVAHADASDPCPSSTTTTTIPKSATVNESLSRNHSVESMMLNASATSNRDTGQPAHGACRTDGTTTKEPHTVMGSPSPPIDNLKYLSVSPPRSCASLTVRAAPRSANQISSRY